MVPILKFIKKQEEIMNKYETIANEVVKNIGGTENIESVTNCMTRLRFTLKKRVKGGCRIFRKSKRCTRRCQ